MKLVSILFDYVYNDADVIAVQTVCMTIYKNWENNIANG